MKHVLVSGASGLLGSALVSSLLSLGWKVTALARSPWQKSNAGLTIIPFDLAKDTVSSLPTNVTAIVHCAAYIPGKLNDLEEADMMLRVNALGTLRLLTWAKEAGVSSFINCSSFSLYQRPVPLPIPEDHPLYPVGHATSYSVSKLIAEIYASSMNSDRFRVCSLRFSSIYGPGMKSSGVLYHFVTSASSGKILKVRSAPTSLFDFLNVNDAVQAILLCLTKPPSYTIFNIGAGRGITLPMLAQTCWEVFGPPKAPMICFEPSSHESSHTVLDISRAQLDIGYDPSFDLLTGLLEMKKRMSD